MLSDPLFLRSCHCQLMMFVKTSIIEMLFSLQTRKGKFPKLNFCSLRSRPYLRGEGPVWAGYPAQEPSSSTQSRSSHQCPGPDKMADLSWQHRQVPRPCPAVITEGARHPDPAVPQASHLTWRDRCMGSIGTCVVANALQVNP